MSLSKKFKAYNYFQTIIAFIIYITVLSSNYTLAIESDTVLSSQQALAEIEHITKINIENSKEALTLLEQLKPSISSTSPILLRRKYLSVLISAQSDSGAIDNAWSNAVKLFELGQKEDDAAAKADGLASQGAILVTQGKVEQAINLFKKSISIAEAIDDHKIALYAYNSYALAENSLGNFQSSLTLFLKAVGHAEQIEEDKDRRMSVLLNNISLLYMSLKDPDKGLEYNKRAFDIAEKAGSKNMLATLLLNRGYAFDSLGQGEKAYLSYLEGYKLAKETDSIRSEAVALINISDYFLRTKDYEQSIDFGKQSLEASEKSGEQSYIDTAKLNIGLALAGLGNVKEGAEQVEAVIEGFRQSNNILDLEGTLGELADLYKTAGMFQKALEVMTEKMTLSEELYKSDREKAVTELQEKFNATQQKKKIELLQRENQIKNAEIINKKLEQRVTVLGGILVVIGSFMVFMLYRKVRKTNLKLESVNTQLEIQSISDPLTGLNNRRSFLNLMTDRDFEDKRAKDIDDYPDALILLDVDNFKMVNDTYGHTAGDMVLIEISKRLNQLMRNTDMVMRWGGEEFLIFVKKPDPKHAQKIVKRVLDIIGATPIYIGGQSIVITVSAGKISLPFCGMSEEEFNWERALQLADMALYLGKIHGRNRAYCVDKLLVPMNKVMPILEKDLSEAMKKGLVEVTSVLGPDKKEQISEEEVKSTDH